MACCGAYFSPAVVSCVVTPFVGEAMILYRPPKAKAAQELPQGNADIQVVLLDALY